jgi:tetratricopeptide (TPR) repeat protein
MLLIISTVAPAWSGDREQIDALNQQMMQLYAQGRYEEATPLASQVLAMLEKALGPESLEVAAGFNNLAELYSKQRRFAEAEPLYKRSLAIRQKLLGPDHPDVAKSLNRLAELYRNQGNDAEAAALPGTNKTSHETSPKPVEAPKPTAPGPAATTVSQDLERAVQLNQQATDLNKQGRYAESLPLAKQVLAIFEKALGPNHPSVAVALANLAQIYVQQKQYDLAEPLYKRCTAILEKARDSSHPDLGFILANLADLYSRQSRYAEAEPLYKRSLSILEKALGPNDPNLAIVLNNLADLYRRQWRYPEADALLKGRVTPRQTPAFPAVPSLPATPVVTPNVKDLEHEKLLEQKLFTLTGQGHLAEALPVAMDLQSDLEKMYGPNSLVVAMNLDILVKIYKGLDRDAEAEPLARRSQAIRDMARAADHSDVAPQMQRSDEITR